MVEEFLAILACPVCKTAPLRYEPSPQVESLACAKCERIYSVKNGIPDMLPGTIAEDLSPKDVEWTIWSSKMENFVQWRRDTWDGSAKADRFLVQANDLQNKFAHFIHLADSGKKIIDIGCGDGRLRKLLGTCSYYGVDPLLIEGCHYDIPIVRGVGEYLPFCDGTFDEAILNQVLDHCNSIDAVLAETVRVVGANGTVNVMQYISEPDNLPARIYKGLLKVYLAIKGVRDLDTKTRRFDRQGLVNYFRERFEKVDFLEYSSTQIFVKASVWKQSRK